MIERPERIITRALLANTQLKGVGTKTAAGILSALNEAGCVVVPKVATEAMLDAASDAMSDIEDYSTTRVEYAAEAYTAMLTAAQGGRDDG